MMKLKEFYQYKRELGKRNKIFRSKLSWKVKNLSPTFFHRVTPEASSSELGEGLLTIKASRNNTIITLANLKGKVYSVKSCGCLGFRGKKKRSTKFAIESTLFSVLKKAKEFRWTKVVVCLNGFATGRFYLLNCLKASNLKVSLLRDITPTPHNGCRAKKLRRG